MILTVTINPLLEKRYIVDNFSVAKVNKSRNEYFYAGGKGINVSRQLNKLAVENHALLFAGGNNGKLLRKVLSDESINFSIVNTSNETRSASLLLDETCKNLTSVFGSNSVVSSKEVEEFKERLKKMIPNYSVIIFSGSSPCEIADEIFLYGINIANKYDKIVILDSYGKLLPDCFNKQPMIVHNNIDELEKSFNVKLRNDDQKISFLQKLEKKGIKMAFITNGCDPSFAMKFGFIYKIENPVIDELDSTGSGDAFVAGIAYGLEKSLVFEEFAITASALGSANALRWDACNVSFDELGRYKNEVKLESVGKKMKLIDDSPTT